MPKKAKTRWAESLTRPVAFTVPDYTYYGLIPANDEGEPAVYDGDTVSLILDLGMDQWIGPIYYRLLGIQAPEIRPLKTRKAGTAARDFLRSLVKKHYAWCHTSAVYPGAGWYVGVKTHKKRRPKEDYRPRAVKGKFGRWLVELIGRDNEILKAEDRIEMINLNQEVVRAGHATLYLP